MPTPRTRNLQFTVMFDAVQITAYCALLRVAWKHRKSASVIFVCVFRRKLLEYAAHPTWILNERGGYLLGLVFIK